LQIVVQSRVEKVCVIIYQLQTKILFVTEIKIKRSLGYTGGFKDLLDSGVVVARLMNDPGTALQDVVFGLLSFFHSKSGYFYLSGLKGASNF